MALILVTVPIVMASCTAHRKTAYLQNISEHSTMTHSERYEVKIQPFDRLYITAFSEGSSTVEAFNILENTPINSRNTIFSSRRPVEYIVDAEGYIHLPLLGRTKVDGKSVGELEEFIANELIKEHYKERPIVTVRLYAFSYTLLGDVASPSVYYSDVDHLNLFEALARAGDMTIYGKRNNVKIIREYPDGTKAIGTIDITSPDITDSPFFNIQQDDIIYVEPNSAKSHNADFGSSAHLWIRGVSIAISIAALICRIVL